MAVTFIQNASLLITLSVLFGLIKWYISKKEIYFQLVSGLWFGVVAIGAMMMPYQYQIGVIYDGRSVVLTLAGLWGGGYTALVAVLVAGAYRIYLGGLGIWAGLTTILFCGITGLIFRQLFKNKLNELKFYSFWGIGVVAHVVMLASQLLLPWEESVEVLSRIWLPVLAVFPLAFAIIAQLIQLIERYIKNVQRIREAEILYRTTLLSIGDAVICTNENGYITQMNAVAENLTGWQLQESKGRKLEEIFRIINENNRENVESPFDKVVRKGTIVGLANHTLLISKSGKEIPIADSGAPIKNENNEIIGVVLVFRDQTEEREHQEKIKQSENKYREREFWLRESQRVGKIGSYDLDILNDRWTSSEVLDEIFGITKENPHTVESWDAIVHPDEQKEMLDYFFNSVVKERQPFEREYRILRENDGALRWVLGHGELQFNESGEPVRMFGTIQDITERKIFEQRLKESEEQFRKAVLLSPIPTMVHDEDGNVINLSDGWTYFSGYTIDDIPSVKVWTQKAYGKNAEEVEKYVADIFNEYKTVYNGEFEITTQNGEQRIWQFYSTPLGKIRGSKKIMLSIAADITQLKSTKKALEESEQAYRHLFENHTAVKFLIDPESGKIVKANEAAAKFYGWAIEELESMNVSEINALPPEKIREAMEEARENKRIYFEFKHRLSNGQVRDVEVFSSRIEYKGKEMLHSIVHDVTDKKRLFDELLIAKEKAEESERLKSAFLANMSHEIRTPLNGILGFTSLLTEEESVLTENKKEYAHIINKSAEGLLKIINDILDISRLETGKTLIEQKPFNAGKMLSTVNSIFQKKLADSGNNLVKLKLEKPNQPIVLNTDENRLVQIFSNLLDNALRFTNQGNVTFGISAVEDGNVELFVSDTGIGIPEEKQQLIFERFSQADESTTRSYGGTGLGLAIVKKLVELMGSEIRLKSEPGKGARFSFKLPYMNFKENKKETEKENQSDYSGKKLKTVLIVEDDKVSQIFFKSTLEKHFSTLVFAETGNQALDLFEKENPDVILMDVGLPDINGLEVVQRIREKNRNVVIIAQTAYAMPEDESKALEAGCNDYIAKPIIMDLLLQKIMSLV